MKNQMNYNRITDRACYNATTTVKVSCVIKTKNANFGSLQTKMRNAMEKEVSRNYTNDKRIPYSIINKIKCKLMSVDEVEEENETFQCVNIECMIDITFEETDNKPEMLMKAILGFFFVSCGNRYLTFTLPFFNDEATYKKGYIQLDNSVYYPNQ